MPRFMDWDDVADDIGRGPISACFIITVLLILFGGGYGLATGVFRGVRDAPARAISDYEWFHRKHERIKALDTQIGTAQAAVGSFEESAGERSTWHREDRIEHARLSTVVVGLQQQRAELAANYNARADMAHRGVFREGDLPEHINPEGGTQ